MRSSPGRTAVHLIVAAGLLAAPLAAQAQTNPGPTGSDLVFDVDPRQGFTYRLTIPGPQPRTTTGAFDLDTARLNVSYEMPAGDETPRRAVNLSLGLAGLYEFRDANGNDRFDLGDEVVRFDAVEDDGAAEVDPIRVEDPAEGAQVTYPLNRRGRVVFELWASPELVFIEEGRPLQPTEAEIDVTLQGVEPRAPDTDFALALRLDSASTEQTGAREIAIDGDRAKALYTWPVTADVEDAPVPIRSTVLEQRVEQDGRVNEEAIVVLAVEPGREVRTSASLSFLHTDPAPPTVIARVLGDPLLFALGLVGAILLVGGNAWAKLKSDGRGTLRDA